MELQTIVQLPSSTFSITHSDSILMIGSCFVENLFPLMENAGFLPECNPSGILYNPHSISQCLRRLACPVSLSEEELFLHQGLFHSFLYHSRFSGKTKEEALRKMNDRLLLASAFLEKTSVLIITLGTSFVYKLKTNDTIVANCHKLPEAHFIRERMSVDAIVKDWEKTIRMLLQLRPELNILFTVSPIRHWKDGAHENQLSKSTLLLAVDQLMTRFDCCSYFPSFEIMMDELRDYRFYADDMLHPSSLAIRYIWDKFSSVYFTKETLSQMKEWEEVNRALAHKPFNSDSAEYRSFLKKAQKRQEELNLKRVSARKADKG